MFRTTSLMLRFGFLGFAGLSMATAIAQPAGGIRTPVEGRLPNVTIPPPRQFQASDPVAQAQINALSKKVEDLQKQLQAQAQRAGELENALASVQKTADKANFTATTVLPLSEKNASELTRIASELKQHVAAYNKHVHAWRENAKDFKGNSYISIRRTEVPNEFCTTSAPNRPEGNPMSRDIDCKVPTP